MTGNRVDNAKAEKLNEVHPGLLAGALMSYHGPRSTTPMPSDAVVLIPKRPESLAATGERLALVGSEVLHERVGDPDRLDSWYHYVVRIDDPALAARAKKFIKKNR